jgi:hypothetical protein
MTPMTQRPAWVDDALREFEGIAVNMHRLCNSSGEGKENQLFSLGRDQSHRFVITVHSVPVQGRKNGAYHVYIAILFLDGEKIRAALTFGRTDRGAWFVQVEIKKPRHPLGREAREIAERIELLPNADDRAIAAGMGCRRKTMIIFRDKEDVMGMLGRTINEIRLRIRSIDV